jgi:transposase-like protein
MLNFNFDSILSLVEAFPTEIHCYQYLESILWKDGVTCPHCGNKHKFWRLKDGKALKCSKCRKRFNVKAGTFFEETRLSLKKWFIAIFLLTVHSKGISSVQLSKDLRITQKTAWFVAHRIRSAMSNFRTSEKFDSTVEVDETYVGGKEKNKHKNKKTKGTQGRSLATKTAVIGILQRSEKDIDGNKISKANVITYKIDDVGSKSLELEVLKNVKPGTQVMSDEWGGYKDLNCHYKHEFIQHNKNEYVKGNIHTNTLEGFWSLFKRMYIGIYHMMSEQHINRYLNALAFRYNHMSDKNSDRFNLVIANCKGRLSHNILTGKVLWAPKRKMKVVLANG